jgi:plasmid maintenance system antidote protein VapI
MGNIAMSSAIEDMDEYFTFDPKDEAASEFVGELGRALQAILVSAKKSDKLTQQALAKKLGIDRSRVNRCFSGYANLTASSIAELGWALGYKPVIAFHRLHESVEIASAVHLTCLAMKNDASALQTTKMTPIGAGEHANAVLTIPHIEELHRATTASNSSPAVTSLVIRAQPHARAARS